MPRQRGRGRERVSEFKVQLVRQLPKKICGRAQKKSTVGLCTVVQMCRNTHCLLSCSAATKAFRTCVHTLKAHSAAMCMCDSVCMWVSTGYATGEALIMLNIIIIFREAAHIFSLHWAEHKCTHTHTVYTHTQRDMCGNIRMHYKPNINSLKPKQNNNNNNKKCCSKTQSRACLKLTVDISSLPDKLINWF